MVVKRAADATRVVYMFVRDSTQHKDRGGGGCS